MAIRNNLMIDGSGKVSPQIACAGTWGKTAATQVRGRPECAKRVRIVGVHSEVEDKRSRPPYSDLRYWGVVRRLPRASCAVQGGRLRARKCLRRLQRHMPT